MPTQLTIPERQQFGVGLFEANNAFNGLAALRWSWPTAFTPTWTAIDLGLGAAKGSALPGVSGGLIVAPNLFTLAGQNAFTNITKGLTHTQHAPATEYVQRAFVLDGVGKSIERIAADMLDTRKDTARKTRPRTIIRWIKPNVKAQIRPYAKRTAEAEARAVEAERKAAALEQRVAALERQVAKPHSIAVPGLPPRIGVIEREWDAIRGRLKNPAKWLGLGAFLMLLAKALEKMGANFIRCSNVKKYGRSICGMNTSLLESLLADALLIGASLSIVEFAKELQAIETEVVRGVRLGVRELRAGYKPVAGKLH